MAAMTAELELNEGPPAGATSDGEAANAAGVAIAELEGGPKEVGDVANDAADADDKDLDLAVEIVGLAGRALDRAARAATVLSAREARRAAVRDAERMEAERIALAASRREAEELRARVEARAKEAETRREAERKERRERQEREERERRERAEAEAIKAARAEREARAKEEARVKALQEEAARVELERAKKAAEALKKAAATAKAFEAAKKENRGGVRYRWRGSLYPSKPSREAVNDNAGGEEEKAEAEAEAEEERSERQLAAKENEDEEEEEGEKAAEPAEGPSESEEVERDLAALRRRAAEEERERECEKERRDRRLKQESERQKQRERLEAEAIEAAKRATEEQARMEPKIKELERLELEKVRANIDTAKNVPKPPEKMPSVEMVSEADASIVLGEESGAEPVAEKSDAKAESEALTGASNTQEKETASSASSGWFASLFQTSPFQLPAQFQLQSDGGEESSPEDMPAPAFDSQVTFCYTSDLEATSSFYEGALNLTVSLDQGACRIYRAAQGAHIGFCSRQEADVPSPDGVILTLVTQDVDAWADRLRAFDVELEKEPTRNDDYDIYHMFFRDPNGYLLEIQRFEDPRWEDI